MKTSNPSTRLSSLASSLDRGPGLRRIMKSSMRGSVEVCECCTTCGKLVSRGVLYRLDCCYLKSIVENCSVVCHLMLTLEQENGWQPRYASDFTDRRTMERRTLRHWRWGGSGDVMSSWGRCLSIWFSAEDGFHQGMPVGRGSPEPDSSGSWGLWQGGGSIPLFKYSGEMRTSPACPVISQHLKKK